MLSTTPFIISCYESTNSCFSISSSCTLDVTLALYGAASRLDWQISLSIFLMYQIFDSLTLNSGPTALQFIPEQSLSNTHIFLHKAHHSLLVLRNIKTAPQHCYQTAIPCARCREAYRYYNIRAWNRGFLQVHRRKWAAHVLRSPKLWKTVSKIV